MVVSSFATNSVLYNLSVNMAVISSVDLIRTFPSALLYLHVTTKLVYSSAAAHYIIGLNTCPNFYLCENHFVSLY